MGLSPGEILFYVGVAGMATVLAVSVIVIIVLAGSRKRLRRKLNDEYGGDVK